jgi:hypothetical protein
MPPCPTHPAASRRHGARNAAKQAAAVEAFLSRPRTTDPLAAASQLEPTLSVGGLPARTRTFCPRDGPLARTPTFCPRGDTLSGCCRSFAVVEGARGHDEQ